MKKNTPIALAWKHTLRGSLGCALLIAGALTVSTSANAEIPGSSVMGRGNCVISPVTRGVYTAMFSGVSSPAAAPMFWCASEATLSGIQTYLETGQKQTLAARLASAAGGGGGVIDQLGANNVQIKEVNGASEQSIATKDLANRELAVQDAIRRGLVKAGAGAGQNGVDTRLCGTAAGMSAGMGGGGPGGGGGASAASASSYAKNLAANQDRVLTPGTENDYVADLVTDTHQPLFCRAEDHTNKVPGCEGGEGKLPGADLNPLVLIMAYQKYPKVGNYSVKSEVSQGGTFVGDGDDHYYAQQAYIRYASPFPGPAISPSAKDSPAGRRFLVLQRRYNSRVLAVVGALQLIASETAALPDDHPFVKEVWNGTAATTGFNLKDDFQTVYGTGPNAPPVPPSPSESEIMHLLVLRQYAPKVAGQDVTPTNDRKYFTGRQVEVKKIQAYLLLKMNERQEQSNILLAHLLSNRVDPVNRASLVGQSGAISSGK